jgi:putative ABC transport system permease protein
LVAFFFAIAAMIGAMITMYAAVASRQREIATLRALGFSKRSILSSFLVESGLIGVVGGATGALASTPLSFVKLSMATLQSRVETVLAFEPSLKTVGSAVLCTLVMGLLGGMLPALRAARAPLASSLRA